MSEGGFGVGECFFVYSFFQFYRKRGRFFFEKFYFFYRIRVGTRCIASNTIRNTIRNTMRNITHKIIRNTIRNTMRTTIRLDAMHRVPTLRGGKKKTAHKKNLQAVF